MHILRFSWSQLLWNGLIIGAIWKYLEFTGSTGKFGLFNIILEIRSVLGAKFSSAYNTSTGASEYIKILKNDYPSNFQNSPKLCITLINVDLRCRCLLRSKPKVSALDRVANSIQRCMIGADAISYWSHVYSMTGRHII